MNFHKWMIALHWLFGLFLQPRTQGNDMAGQWIKPQSSTALSEARVMEVIFMRTCLKGMLFILSSSVLIFILASSCALGPYVLSLQQNFHAF